MKYEISVRSLCEFTAKQGDLDLRFTPGPPHWKALPDMARSLRAGLRTTSGK